MRQAPSLDSWLREAKQSPNAGRIGVYLVHNGVVRETARARVRQGDQSAAPVIGMRLTYDEETARLAVEEARKMEGVFYVRLWLNEDELSVGDDLMLVLIGGDTRPRAEDALQRLVSRLKGDCVTETEIYGG